jgi:hypothetical protein
MTTGTVSTWFNIAGSSYPPIDGSSLTAELLSVTGLAIAQNDQYLLLIDSVYIRKVIYIC